MLWQTEAKRGFQRVCSGENQLLLPICLAPGDAIDGDGEATELGNRLALFSAACLMSDSCRCLDNPRAFFCSNNACCCRLICACRCRIASSRCCMLRDPLITLSTDGGAAVGAALGLLWVPALRSLRGRAWTGGTCGSMLLSSDEESRSCFRVTVSTMPAWPARSPRRGGGALGTGRR
jgi:hypothetical protein